MFQSTAASARALGWRRSGVIVTRCGPIVGSVDGGRGGCALLKVRQMCLLTLLSDAGLHTWNEADGLLPRLPSSSDRLLRELDEIEGGAARLSSSDRRVATSTSRDSTRLGEQVSQGNSKNPEYGVNEVTSDPRKRPADEA